MFYRLQKNYKRDTRIERRTCYGIIFVFHFKDNFVFSIFFATHLLPIKIIFIHIALSCLLLRSIVSYPCMEWLCNIYRLAFRSHASPITHYVICIILPTYTYLSVLYVYVYTIPAYWHFYMSCCTVVLPLITIRIHTL